MQKVLYITSNNPWGTGGGACASGLYLRLFLNIFREYNIDLCICSEHLRDIPKSFQEKNPNIVLHSVKKRSMIGRICTIFNGHIHRFHGYVSNLLKSNSYDYCIFDRSDTAGSLITLLNKKTKSIVVHHNFEQKYFKDNIRPIFWFLFGYHIKKGEKNAYLKSNLNLFLSEDDRIELAKVYGKSSGSNLCTGLFQECAKLGSNAVNLQSIAPTIIITGSLNNVQNIDGINYFVEHLYPLIPKNIHVIIAGQHPSEELIELLEPLQNVELIPNPTNMDDIIRRGNIFLCPTRLGSGIKVRLNDGFRNGLPVLTHQVSARGFNKYAEQDMMRIFGNTKDFDTQLKGLIDDIYNNKISGQRIQDFYNSSPDAETIASQLSELIRSL